MSSYHRERDKDPLFRAERKIYLDRSKHCRICGDYVRREKRSIDHIIPMWRYEGPYWNRRNWQMLDLACHAKKTKLEGQP